MKKIILNTNLPKFVLLTLFFCSIAFFNSCKKHTEINQSANNTETKTLKAGQSEFISASKTEISLLAEWYKSNRQEKHTLSTLTPNWEDVTSSEDEGYVTYEVGLFNPDNVFTSSEKVELGPTKQNPLHTFRLLVIKNKKDGKLSGGYLSVAPQDKSDPKNRHFGDVTFFSGKISLFNMRGKFIKGLIYKDGLVKTTITYQKETLDAKKITSLYNKATQRTSIMSKPSELMADNCNYELEPVYGQACVEVGGYQGCSLYIREYNIVYYCNNVQSIRPSDLEDQYGGAPSIPADLIPDTPPAPSGNHEPIDPQKFMDCFTGINNNGASYKVTLQVQEPIPGSPAPYGWNGVGHTAITISKTGTNGSVTQTVGFYPSGNTFSSPSKMVDNGAGTEFTVSLEVNVTAANFNNILAYIASPPANYHIINMNCTTFALGAFASAGISLPNADTNVSFMSNPFTSYASTSPGPLGLNLRVMKSLGDTRVKSFPGAAPTSSGPCN